MNILIVSYYFAPFNTMAAVRLSALSEYLIKNGHDVRIIAAGRQKFPATLQTSINPDRVMFTRWIDVDAPRSAVARLASYLRTKSDIAPSTAAGQATSTGRQSGLVKTAAAHLLTLYDNLINLPDNKIGWLPFADHAAKRLVKNWKPDIVYASAPPPTALLVGARIAGRLSVPLVAEIRDRWADDPYDFRFAWRKKLDRSLERRVLSGADKIVTVSETWGAFYHAQYRKPVAVVYNGFDPEDYRRVTAKPATGLPLRLVYTGSVYAGRDPEPLWRALAAMGAAANDISVEFYGTRRDEVLPGAMKHGVDHLVYVEEYVSHERAVELQCGADVLLMLQWDNPSEAGNIPGKLSEYIGAGRPILALGYAEGEMARIIQQITVGSLSNDPEEISFKIMDWLRIKSTSGRIPACLDFIASEFTRENGFIALESFLARIESSEISLDGEVSAPDRCSV